MSDQSSSKKLWNDDDLPVLTELAASELDTPANEPAALAVPPVTTHTPPPDLAISPAVAAVQPPPAAEVSVTPSSSFPFELLLVSDEQEQEQEQVESKANSPARGDALSMIEQRLAAMQAGIKNIPSPSLSPSEAPRKSAPQVAVLGETALTEALYQAVLPRVKAEIMVWMQELLVIQTQQLCEGVVRQFTTDYEVMFGDALRDSLRQAVHEVRRQPLKKG